MQNLTVRVRATQNDEENQTYTRGGQAGVHRGHNRESKGQITQQQHGRQDGTDRVGGRTANHVGQVRGAPEVTGE